LTEKRSQVLHCEHGLNGSSTLGPGASPSRMEASGLPTNWTRVHEQNTEAMNPLPLPGYVWWLDNPCLSAGPWRFSTRAGVVAEWLKAPVC
jgi:hypothetical protein